jgi:ribosomal protein S6
MKALELANEIEKGGKDGFYQDEMVAILRQQVKEIEELRRIVESIIKQAFYEDDYHQLKAKFDAQAKELEQLRFVLRNVTLATSKKIGELETELEAKGK